MQDANQDNFDRAVIAASHQQPVLVDFWAPWCGPCRALGPVLERVEQDMGGQFLLVKVNSDENPKLSAQYQVRSIPFVLLFRDGKPVDSFVGALPEGRIRAFLAKHLPRPGDDQIAQAHKDASEGRLEDAAQRFSTALAINPAQDEARLAYVRVLIRLGRVDDARLAFEPLKVAAQLDMKTSAVGQLLSAAEAVGACSEADCRIAVETSPGDLSARLKLAQRLLLDEQWQPAMDELLEIISRDRKFGNDLPRKVMLAVFELCGDAQLVGTYRRRLSAGLY